jgi:uncharacterized protein (DUF433 family)
MIDYKGRNKKIVEHYRKHGDLKKLAKEYELTPSAIRVVLNNQGIFQEVRKKNIAAASSIIKAYKNGLETAEIAAQFNVDVSAVIYILNKAGIFKPGRRVMVRDKKIIKDIKKGISYKDIAKRYKVFESYISIVGRRHGIHKQQKLTNKILAMLEQESNQSEIARQLNITSQNVSYVYNKYKKRRN